LGKDRIIYFFGIIGSGNACFDLWKPYYRVLDKVIFAMSNDQFNEIFKSIRVSEINSFLDKHRRNLNKINSDQDRLICFLHNFISEFFVLSERARSRLVSSVDYMKIKMLARILYIFMDRIKDLEIEGVKISERKDYDKLLEDIILLAVSED